MKKIIVLSLVLAVFLSACASKKTLSIEEAKVAARDFINNNLMQPGQEVSIKEVVEEGGLYKVVVNLPSGQELESYLTKDGEIFFPQAMKVEEFEQKTKERAAQQEAEKAKQLAEIPKADKPKVELFVMSHCPYGTQIEKGILPVVKKLGDKIDFEVKFVDYAMHGEKEIDEQLRQYCIQKEQPQKYLDYLECFLADGQSDKCLEENGIAVGKMNSCTAATDSQYKIREKFADKSTWSSGRYPSFDIYKSENEKYGVKGSPTLVINGKIVQTQRDPNSLLKVICSGFNTQPDECSSELSSAAPSPGFGFGGEGSGSSGSCN